MSTKRLSKALTQAIALVATVATFGSAMPGTAQVSGPTADIAAINTALADLLRAYEQGNLAGITAVMANELQAFGSTFNAVSLDEFRTKAADTLRGIRGVKPASQQDVTMSGNLAYVGFFTDVQREAPGGVVMARSRWTVVFQKMNNRWVVVHYHLSPDPTAR